MGRFCFFTRKTQLAQDIVEKMINHMVICMLLFPKKKKKIVTCDAVSFQEIIFSRYSLIFKVLTPGNKFSC
jgi:hypothetical protein